MLSCIPWGILKNNFAPFQWKGKLRALSKFFFLLSLAIYINISNLFFLTDSERKICYGSTRCPNWRWERNNPNIFRRGRDRRYPTLHLFTPLIWVETVYTWRSNISSSIYCTCYSVSQLMEQYLVMEVCSPGGSALLGSCSSRFGESRVVRVSQGLFLKNPVHS